MTEEQIGKNVAHVKAEIAQAAGEAGRDPAEILLVAATKMNDADSVRAAIRAGVDICGENRVQEMLEKNAQGAYEGAPLHFIGHLQKNKVRQVVGLCSLIHSVDSLSLLQEISKTAQKRGLTQDVLLEVNIGNEESKSGFSPEEIGITDDAVIQFRIPYGVYNVLNNNSIPVELSIVNEDEPSASAKTLSASDSDEDEGPKNSTVIIRPSMSREVILDVGQYLTISEDAKELIFFYVSEVPEELPSDEKEKKGTRLDG